MFNYHNVDKYRLYRTFRTAGISALIYDVGSYSSTLLISSLNHNSLLVFPADIGRAGFAGSWEPVSPATPTRQLLKRPTAQHGGTHMERQNQKRDSQSDRCLIS